MGLSAPPPDQGTLDEDGFGQDGTLLARGEFQSCCPAMDDGRSPGSATVPPPGIMTGCCGGWDMKPPVEPTPAM